MVRFWRSMAGWEGKGEAFKAAHDDRFVQGHPRLVPMPTSAKRPLQHVEAYP